MGEARRPHVVDGRTYLSIPELARLTGVPQSTLRAALLRSADEAVRPEMMIDRGRSTRPRWLVAADALVELGLGAAPPSDTEGTTTTRPAAVEDMGVDQLRAEVHRLRSVVHALTIASKIHLEAIADLTYPEIPRH